MTNAFEIRRNNSYEQNKAKPAGFDMLKDI